MHNPGFPSPITGSIAINSMKSPFDSAFEKASLSSAMLFGETRIKF